MRQVHKAGEKCFIDYCGVTVPVVSPATGEVRQAQVFVAVLGASIYTYAETTWSQSLRDWLQSHVRTFEFFDGVPALLVPDNLRSGVSKACRYDPELNPSYHQLAEHYQVAVMSARPYKPKDKSKVAVQIVERWIIARLRHQTFFSLGELNHTLRSLLESQTTSPSSNCLATAAKPTTPWITRPCGPCLCIRTSTPTSSRGGSTSTTTSPMTSTSTSGSDWNCTPPSPPSRCTSGNRPWPAIHDSTVAG